MKLHYTEPTTDFLMQIISNFGKETPGIYREKDEIQIICDKLNGKSPAYIQIDYRGAEKRIIYISDQSTKIEAWFYGKKEDLDTEYYKKGCEHELTMENIKNFLDDNF